MKSLLLTALSLIFLTLCISCSEKETPAYSEFYDFGPEGWQRLATLGFDVPDDSISPCSERDCILVIRHTDALPYDSLWLCIEETSGERLIRRDTIPVAFTRGIRGWSGRGNRGLYEVRDTLRSFSSAPRDYHITLSHAMKREVIPGIKNIGVIFKRKK